MIKKELNVIVQDILHAIAERYVRNGYKIPDDILALKDETTEIFDKCSKEEDAAVLEQCKSRLEEIRALVTELNYAPPSP